MAEATTAGGPARALLRGGAIAVVLVAAGFALRNSGVGALRAVPATPMGALALVAVGGLLTASGLPRQVVAFAGGYVFGPWVGGLVSLLAQLLGCVLAYVAARGIAADWAAGFLANRKRLAGLRGMLAAHPFGTTLTLRLLPMSNNLVLNLLAGAAAVRAAPFLAASCLGYMPQTAIFALLGGGVQVGRGVQLALGAGLFVVSAALAILLYRRSAKLNYVSMT